MEEVCVAAAAIAVVNVWIRLNILKISSVYLSALYSQANVPVHFMASYLLCTEPTDYITCGPLFLAALRMLGHTVHSLISMALRVLSFPFVQVPISYNIAL